MPSAEDEDCIDKSLLDASLTSEKKKKKKKKKAVKISGASNSSTPNNKQVCKFTTNLSLKDVLRQQNNFKLILILFMPIIY